jgi:hypothetical protein
MSAVCSMSCGLAAVVAAADDVHSRINSCTRSAYGVHGRSYCSNTSARSHVANSNHHNCCWPEQLCKSSDINYSAPPHLHVPPGHVGAAQSRVKGCAPCCVTDLWAAKGDEAQAGEAVKRQHQRGEGGLGGTLQVYMQAAAAAAALADMLWAFVRGARESRLLLWAQTIPAHDHCDRSSARVCHTNCAALTSCDMQASLQGSDCAA